MLWTTIGTHWLRQMPAPHHGHRAAPKRAPLRVQRFEDRTVPANFTAANVSELIAHINTANLTPEADTIALVGNRTYTLTAVNNTTNGPTGLPTIQGALTLQGNGATIARKSSGHTPA